MAYSQEDKTEIIKKVLFEIENGLSLRKAILKLNIVSRDTFNEWLKEDKNVSDQYARSCEERADSIFEEIIEIADDSSNDFVLTDVGDGMQVERFNSEHVQRSRLRVDARKWMLGKMQSKKYGDKMDVTSGGEKLQNSSPNIKVTIVKPLEEDE
jgi:hypothetical protein